MGKAKLLSLIEEATRQESAVARKAIQAAAGLGVPVDPVDVPAMSPEAVLTEAKTRIERALPIDSLMESAAQFYTKRAARAGFWEQQKQKVARLMSSQGADIEQGAGSPALPPPQESRTAGI